MPVVTVIPTWPSVENGLALRMSEVRSILRQAICDASGFPENDVLVHLARCPYRDADLASASVAVYVDTCPHEKLEAVSNLLRNSMARLLINMRLGGHIEVWIRFLPGPWVLIKDGQIVDQVDHPRERDPDGEIG